MCTTHSTQRSITFLAMLALMLCFGGTARAQRFEVKSPGSIGHSPNNVTSLSVNTGYVAVGGTSNTGCPGGFADLLVMRFNLDGTVSTGWPKIYDIGGSCASDHGFAVVECTNGDFVIAGTSSHTPSCGSSGTNFLMRITSTGTVSWVRMYPYIDITSLVEATLNNSGSTPDLIICGSWYNSTALISRPMIARVDGSNGSLIWNQTYQISDAAYFWEVIEAKNVGAGGAGDIVACFLSIDGPGLIRVDGSAGTIGPGTLQGVARYTSTEANFHPRSIQELQVAPHGGDIVLTGVGHTAQPDPVLPGSHIHVLRIAPNLCTINANAYHGAENQSHPHAIREIDPPSSSGLTAGNLVIVGEVEGDDANGGDMFLVELEPTTLSIVTPTSGVGFHIYDYLGGDGHDQGYSVDPVYEISSGNLPSDGFILGGVSITSGVMYLVKTNALGNEAAACDDGTLTATSLNPLFTAHCPIPAQLDQPVTDCAVSNTTSDTHSANRNCYVFPKEATPGDDVADITAGLALRSAPNPLRRGEDLHLTITTATARSISCTIVDAAGRAVATIEHALGNGENQLDVSTRGWASGTYTIRVTAEEHTSMLRVVVID